MKAKLSIQSVPKIAPSARRVLIDCRHGTTRALWVNAPGGFALSEQQAVCMALLKHDAEEGCACTRKLWAQHGPRAGVTRTACK